jgi:hypothetical protein
MGISSCTFGRAHGLELIWHRVKEDSRFQIPDSKINRKKPQEMTRDNALSLKFEI